MFLGRDLNVFGQRVKCFHVESSIFSGRELNVIGQKVAELKELQITKVVIIEEQCQLGQKQLSVWQH